VEESFDLAVLSVGMEVAPETRKMAERLGIALDQDGFAEHKPFQPLETSRRGVFVAGPFGGPKDIPETVVEASAAAAQAEGLLSQARGTLTQEKEYPLERDVAEAAPRIGVFVCHCGSNIGGFLDVPSVAEYSKSLPNVVHAEDNLYTCSQDSVEIIKERIAEHDLNRVVVASCTPHTHEPMFQDTIRQAGLNEHLFEMANIRNQCSWVHSNDPERATEKAKDLVRMSVARAAFLHPLHSVDMHLNRSALVIGGGVAGMSAALSLADQGFPVHLIERTDQLGGNLRHVHYTLEGADPQAYLKSLIQNVEAQRLITVHTETELKDTSGFIGNFTSRLLSKGQDLEVEHGIIIVATGGREYQGSEYLYGEDDRVVTQRELETRIAADVGYVAKAKNVVMIQCVGPADRYCSRICCSVAVKNALKIKEVSPSTEVYVLYRDMRTFGLHERYYTQARQKGVHFIHYDRERPPEVRKDGGLMIDVHAPLLNADLALPADLVVLSTGLLPAEGADRLASALKVPVDLDGFFLEAHIKLRPVDFVTEGIFVAGAAHYPKFLEECIVQAQAATARASTILSQETLRVGGVVAVVEPEKCTACLTCVRVCPYNVPVIDSALVGAGGITGAARIEVAACQGCGICAAECPAGAIQLMHYRDEQVVAEEEALLARQPELV
jgi:heterodisulfide reductase subunit A